MASFGEAVSTSPSIMLDQTKFLVVQIFGTLEVFDVILLELLGYHITQKPGAIFDSCMKGAEPEWISALLAEDLPGYHAYHAAAL